MQCVGKDDFPRKNNRIGFREKLLVKSFSFLLSSHNVCALIGINQKRRRNAPKKMIKIKCLSGSYAGEARTPPPEMNPAEIFASLVQYGWAWEVDYTAATNEEILLWFRAELVARILRALKAGLPVQFLDGEYLASGDDLAVVAGELEDVIVASGREVTIDSDDERGLVIGVRGYEGFAV